MTRFLLICLGGALGTGARYLVSLWAVRTFGTAFSWGTLLVNVVGSFLLALVLHAGMESSSLSVSARLFLGTGVMGGFTTYSAFSHETFTHLQAGAHATAALYVGVTLLGCLAATALGVYAGRALTA